MPFTPADVIAVTGANGFVGAALCRDLARRGAAVRPLTRGGEHRFDLADATAFTTDAVRAVIHCAYDAAASKQVNVDGTIQLAETCAAAGVGQFVFVSSLAAHAAAESDYGRGKWELEQRLAALPGPMVVTIVKPGTVLGDGGLFAQIRRLAGKLPALPLFFSGGGRRLQTVLVDDLCDAVAVAVDRRLPGTFAVAEPVGVPLAEFHRAVAAMDGRRPWLVRLPGGVALPLVRAVERLGVRLPVNSNNLLGLKHLAPFDTAATRAALGVHPRDFQASVRAIADSERTTL